MLFHIPYHEWIGYAAMAFVAFSFLMKNIRHLRIINSIGAALFIYYGFLLETSWPIVITNAFILSLNIYYILKNKG